MQLIKDIVTTPSAALQAMIDGLAEQSKRPDFEIDMRSFGRSWGGICFGCAATCAIQKIGGKNLTEKYIRDRAEFFGFGYGDMEFFEAAIDNSRAFNFTHLFIYYSKEKPDFLLDYNANKCMTTANWQELIPTFQEIVDRLKSEGL